MSQSQMQNVAQQSNIIPISRGAQRRTILRLNNDVPKNERDDEPAYKRGCEYVCNDSLEIRYPIAENGKFHLYTEIDPRRIMPKSVVDRHAMDGIGFCLVRASNIRCTSLINSGWCTRHNSIMFNHCPVKKVSNGRKFTASVGYTNVAPGQLVKLWPLITFMDCKKPQPELYNIFMSCFTNWAEVAKNMTLNEDLYGEMKIIARFLSYLVHVQASSAPNFRQGRLTYEIWKTFMYEYFHSERLQNYKLGAMFSRSYYEELAKNEVIAEQPWFQKAVTREDGNRTCMIPFNFLSDIDKSILSQYMPAASYTATSTENLRFRSVGIPNVQIYNGILIQGNGGGITHGLMNSIGILNGNENTHEVIETTNMVIQAIAPTREPHIVCAVVNEEKLKCLTTNMKAGALEQELRNPLSVTKYEQVSNSESKLFTKLYT